MAPIAFQSNNQNQVVKEVFVDTPTTTTVHVGSSKPTTIGRRDGDFSHPLDPLTPNEIEAVSICIRKYIMAHPELEIKAFKFATTNVIHPQKRDVLAWLGIPIAPGEKPEPAIRIMRRAEVDFIDLVSGFAYNATTRFTPEEGGKWEFESIEKLPEGTQPQITVEELGEAENSIRNDPRIREYCKEVGITPDQIYADGWSIGYDDRFPKGMRIQQGFVFARYSEHENLYAHPLDFFAVLDSNTLEVIHVDFPPHRIPSSPNGSSTPPDVNGESDLNMLTSSSTAPPSLEEDSFQASGRPRIPPPPDRFDFLSDLMADTSIGPLGSKSMMVNRKTGEAKKPRTDIKPLHVVQPEGVSFTMNGNELSWQKWNMHIAFSPREGLAISTVTYNDDGELRPLFYRLSLVEMIVPYAAPEFPHSRKFAFDAGEYGMGTQVNDLTLGCDCLGNIHYLPGSYVRHDGTATVIKNAICIHEEDVGLLWKHTDYRTGGRSRAVRNRRLVVSMICTLANYEYIWNYFFYQDGSIEIEVRLSGILQVYVKHPAEKVTSAFGTTIAPNITAHFHQHIFSFRVDPMIDGLKNSVVETDILPLEAGVGSDENYAGNAFVLQESVVKTEGEGGREYDFQKDRRWKIVNRSRKHYASAADVGYVIGMKGGIVPLLAQEGGWVAKRVSFAQKPIWVVRDEEGAKGGRIWPSGKYVPQSRDTPEDSVSKWAQGDRSVEDEDILVFLSVGTTHIPRPEDWPVMPVEHLRVTLKPLSFFDMNPAMDVPDANDHKSKPAFVTGGAQEHDHDSNVGSCCTP